MLRNAGFTKITSVGLTKDRVGEYLREEEEEYQVEEWREEWTAPLYRAILAYK